MRLTYLLKRAFLELEELHAEHLHSSGVNAGELGVDRTTMVGLLDGLEGKGLVARQADPGDRRRNVVVLTDAGQQTLTQATAASDEAERELLSELSEADALRLRELLGRVAAGRARP